MRIGDLIKLADLLDANGEHTAADELDQLVKKVAEEEGVVISPETLEEMRENVDKMNGNLEDTIEFLRNQGYQINEPVNEVGSEPGQVAQMENMPDAISSINDVFEKLATVADSLDMAGAQQEADMIDQFIKKHAAGAMSDKPTAGIEHLTDSPVGEIWYVKTPKGKYIAFSQAEANKMAQMFDKDPGLLETYMYFKKMYGVGAVSEEDAEKLEQEFEKYMQEPTAEQGLGPDVEKEMGEASEELEKLQSSYNPNIPKQAEGVYDVVDWKEEADTEQSKRYDYEHHHNLQVREPKRDQERVDREGRKEHHISNYSATDTHALSSRYCPDHRGVQMGRVGEATYQCPLDGKTYNWDTGFTDYDGNQRPGGSVAAQTPDSSGYGIPHRIFDTRENTLNEIN